MTEVHAELARVVREHAGRLTGCLTRLLGDFTAAECLTAYAKSSRWSTCCSTRAT